MEKEIRLISYVVQCNGLTFVDKDFVDVLNKVNSYITEVKDAGNYIPLDSMKSGYMDYDGSVLTKENSIIEKLEAMERKGEYRFEFSDEDLIRSENFARIYNENILGSNK